MFGLFRGATRTSSNDDTATTRAPAPETVTAPGVEPFRIADHLDRHDGFPLLRWDDVRAWLGALPNESDQARAWLDCERAWLLHMRDALGPGFHLAENDDAIVVSSLETRLVRYTLEFMQRTLRRIVKVLDGVAEVPPWGKDLLVVFDDEESYYRYVSHTYPEKGEFAFSSGMHLDRGCSHYVTTKSDLKTIEPVIAHEMTHGCVSHLPLPLWLNEGLAVNTEHRVVGPGVALHTPLEMHAKHLGFWGDDEIQEFWSGQSFRRSDDGNMLSYDLARVLVEHLSRDWPRFRAFATSASWEDAGFAAAREHLDIDLGVAAAAILERDDPGSWSPDPGRWKKNETQPE